MLTDRLTAETQVRLLAIFARAKKAARESGGKAPVFTLRDSCARCGESGHDTRKFILWLREAAGTNEHEREFDDFGAIVCHASREARAAARVDFTPKQGVRDNG